MRHELVYVLGQIGDKLALPTLEEVLRAEDEDAMVRHEVRARRLTPRCSRARHGLPQPPLIQAAEAMGAMAFPESLGLLEQYEHHSTTALAETCQLAISRIRWVLAQQVRRADRCGLPIHRYIPFSCLPERRAGPAGIPRQRLPLCGPRPAHGYPLRSRHARYLVGREPATVRAIPRHVRPAQRSDDARCRGIG